MTYSIREITVSPPGARTHRGVGWSRVFIHLDDASTQTMPSVTLEVSVPYQPSDTFQKAREAALDRAKAIIQAASDGLQEASLQEIDKGADQDRQLRTET